MSRRAGQGAAPARKVLFFVTEDWFFRSHFLERARAARDAGYRVVVLTRAPDGGESLRGEGLEIHALPLDRAGLHPLREIATLWRVVRAYRTLRPDLVHHVAMKPILYGTLAARLLGIRAVVNAPVGMGFVFTSRSWRARLLRPLLSAALRLLLDPPGARVVLENEDDARELARLGWVRPRDVRIVRGAGVDLELFRPADSAPREVRVVLPARMLLDKGVREFVCAARMLQREGVEAQFLLAGSIDASNPSAIPEHRLQRWAREGVVRWLGHVVDMPGLLGQASIVCLPSYREGLPKALVEATACGLPVVTTDVPGCRDVVRHGCNGLLVPARDAPALARALRALIESPALRALMGAAGRERAVATFGAEQINRQTVEIYRELLGG